MQDNIMSMVASLTCTGCGMCASLCPKGYIQMKPGKLGFPMPYIDENCEKCGACLRGCPVADDAE